MEDDKIMLQRKAVALAVPTNDAAVRGMLRQLGHPITLFAEKEMERRDRLRYILAKELPAQKAEAKEESVKISAVQKSTFFTEGSADLLRARYEIAHYSLPRAEARLAKAKRRSEDEEAKRSAVLKAVCKFSLDCSEIADDRPVTSCAFSPDSKLVATCGWTGNAKMWTVPDLSRQAVFKGHTERLTDVVFSPDGKSIATASADRQAMLWDLEGNRKMTFRGHVDRLARLAFHPSGLYLGTASFDKTWRLWDVNTGAEVLLQEGHSRGLYGIAFQCDGSLVASCGVDALARVWDLRTGRSIAALEGHVKPVLGVDFSPNGYHLATGSEDHTCKVWDLRRKPQHLLYTIPAHSGLITTVKYEKADGYYFMTASFDNTAKVWSASDFKHVKTLSGHEGRLTGLDLSPDGQYVATVSHDRTLKLWSQKDSPEETEEAAAAGAQPMEAIMEAKPELEVKTEPMETASPMQEESKPEPMEDGDDEVATAPAVKVEVKQEEEYD